MFYDDVRALRQIYANALEDSSSEVSAAVLLEISTLCLRCASRWLAAEQAYVWARAKDLWSSHGAFLNVFQNILSGGTFFTVEERLEALDVSLDPLGQDQTQILTFII